MGEVASLGAIGELGVNHGRVIPEDFEAPEGSAVYVLGAAQAGWEQRVAVNTSAAITASGTPAGSPKLVRFKARIRGPQRMPVLSALENFALADGDTLNLAIDGSPQVVTFDAASFAAIGTARASEVAGVINRDIEGGKAFLTGTGEFGIVSDTFGRESSVEIIGGTAAAALNLRALRWRAGFLISGSPIPQTEIILRVGEERDLTDLGFSLAPYSAPYALQFALIMEYVP